MEGQICQSCGMPLKEERDFGTNEDGSKNKKYCVYCFQNGKFMDEDITMEEKIAKNIEIAKSMGMREEEAREMANSIIPTLERWKK